MRLTIARKIALAVIAIVILCVGTMAWVASSNLQRGFVAYLNDMQAKDLEKLRDLLAVRYRQEGHWDWLRRQPRKMRDLLDQLQPQTFAEPDGQIGHRPPPPSGREGFAPPPERDRHGPPERGEGPPRERPDPSGRPDDPHPPRPGQPPPQPRDPMQFASRISITDIDGRPVIGPPDFPPGIERAIEVDGKPVGRIRLLPLRQAAGADASAGVFLREQIQDILLLSAALIAMAILAAIWLARHMLRPVAALRDVTARLARGEFEARAPLLSRDELAELALHVNAMAEALQESEQQRRTMIADISHELRTPLTVIRGELEALLDGIRQADPNALESLHAEVLRLTKLVEDLHQITLADAGDLHYQWQMLDLAELLEALLTRFRPRAAAAGLTLEWRLPDFPVTLQGDAGRLTQVIMNLLENSVRYTDAGGSIVVNLGTDARHALLAIDDSAPGVPEGAHAHLFERLYRVDKARTRERGGSGLGLAICKVLIDAHGGSIGAQPSPLGGVRMLVRLPLRAHTGK